MTHTSGNSSARWLSAFRATLRQRSLRRAAANSPTIFRKLIRLETGDGPTFDERLQDWQRADFEALDPAWMRLARVTFRSGTSTRGHWLPEAVPPKEQLDDDPLPATSGTSKLFRPVFQRAWIERPRGHSKTCDVAVQLAWVVLFARRAIGGVVAAVDLDQSRLVFDAVRRLVEANPEFCGELQVLRNELRNPRTGSSVTLVAADVHSSWGTLPDVVVCDELCHWARFEMWQSLASSAAKKPECVLVVLTNAGVGRGWQWELREQARTSDAWHFSSLTGCRAPWIERRWLDEQRALLPRPVYERLWENVWQHSDGEFVTLAEAEACRDPALRYRPWGEAEHAYFAAVDYAEKHDDTVGVVVHREGTRVIVDRLDVVRPTPGNPTPVAWVERWIEAIAAAFPHVRFVLDPHQLVGTIQRLEQRFPVERFEFAGGRGNHELATTLSRLIVGRDVAWYPGCGAIDAPHGRDDLETELASLRLRQTSGGRIRFDHVRDGRHHDDRAFTLGVACLHCLKARGATDWLRVTPPASDGGFHW